MCLKANHNRTDISTEHNKQKKKNVIKLVYFLSLTTHQMIYLCKQIFFFLFINYTLDKYY